MDEALILSTKAGFTISIETGQGMCTVSRGGQVETVKGSPRKDINQEIPTILFIGRRFEILVPTGDFILLNLKEGKLVLPYRMWPDKETHYIFLSAGTMSDQFPAWIDHYESVGQYESDPEKKRYRYVFFDPDTSNYQKMTFKIKHPEFKILIVRPGAEKGEVEEDPEEPVQDPESQSTGNLSSQNPIFQAKFFLRNKETDQLKQMLMEYDFTSEDVHIIRAFVKNMLDEMPEGDPKLSGQLHVLDELMRLHSLITDPDKTLFENELDKGLNSAVALDLIPIVEQLRGKAASKEDEIVFWEWEYRLGKIAGKKTD
ncbi:MAG: hypothetical protein OEZ34_13525 [Spirochaetia bacterium]|nr:hypothetical protein [Spirochaetia bacterium]